MVNFNSKYTILVIVLVALALLFAIWGIYKRFLKKKPIDASKTYEPLRADNDYRGGKRHSKKNKKSKK